MKNKIILLIGLSIFISTFLQNVYAEEDTPVISEDDYIGDLPKVLTVSRLSQPLSDAPSAVTVIDQETIRAAGIVDLPEIFRLVPGMYVAANAGFIQSTDYAVSYHGMTGAYPGSMQVLINGRSVYSPLYGGVNWSQLPIAIADIERIEVTRGPNAASYGANSFLGVINIVTLHPHDLPNNSIIATHGNGRNEVFYRHAGKVNDLSYRVTLGYRDDDGFDNRNDFKRTQFLNAQGDYRINDQNTLELELGLMDGDREEGEITRDKLVFLPREKDINSHYELIRWRHDVGDNSDFSLQAYHSFDRSDDMTVSSNLKLIVPILLNNTITVKNPVESERYDIEAQHNFSVGDKLRLVWGGGLRQDGMRAPHYLGTDETDYFNLQRIFGHAEWQASQRMVVNAGAMLEHNDFTGTDFSPRGSINFKLTPQHTIRLGISSALRTPNYLEEKFNRRLIIPTVAPFPTVLFQYTKDKDNLEPEKIISREIGYLGQVGNLSLDARLYHDSLYNNIRMVPLTGFVAPPGFTLIIPSNGINTGVNAGTATLDGFELQLKWLLNPETHVLFNYAGENIRQTVPSGFTPALKKDLENSAPGNAVSMLVTHQFNDSWDGSIAYYQTSKVEALGDGQPVGLIRKANVRLARKFNIGSKNGEVSAVVENLFDNDYREFANYNIAKRRAWVNLSLGF